MAGRNTCCHCQQSTAQTGSKPLRANLNLGPGPARTVAARPTILEALTLVLGFQLPVPSIVIDSAAGVEYLNGKDYSYNHLSLCGNCEKLLAQLYKVFLLFTELSQGKASFILKNSIISGRVEKESPFLNYGHSNGSSLGTMQQVSVPSTLRVTPSQTIKTPTVNTIRRELTSEVVAEIYVSSSDRGATAQTLKTQSTPPSTPGTNIVEIIDIITVEDEDERPAAPPQLKRAKRPASSSVGGITPRMEHQKVPTSQLGNQGRPPLQKKRALTEGITPPVLEQKVPPSQLVNQGRAVVTSRLRPRNGVTTKTNVTPNISTNKPNGNPSSSRCFRCALTFKSAGLFQAHMKRHSKSTDSTFKCPYNGCDKKYNALRLLRRHQTIAKHPHPPTRKLLPMVATSTDEDYWTTGVEVIHDPEHVMKNKPGVASPLAPVHTVTIV